MVVALHHEVSGRGEPVVLLHGQGGRVDAWELQVAALASRYRVVGLDLRGHGRSPVPPGPYTMTALAADVAATIRGLGLGACHVVGHSLGGMVALQLALDAPALVRSLAVVNATAFGDGSRLRSFAVRAFVRLRGMAAFARANASLHLPEPEQGALRERLIATMGACPADGYLACQPAVDRFDVRARLGEIACPVLVVHSALDVIPLADKRTIADGVPRGRLVTIEGSRHVVLWDRPAALAAALLEFLGGLVGRV